MEPDEEVVSDVHLFLQEHDRTRQIPERHFGKYPVYISRFLFRDLSSSKEIQVNDVDIGSEDIAPELDEDGDLILPRRSEIGSEVVHIEHALSTHLPDVGLQVWPGCMILCDFIVNNRKAFENKVVVELGAGVGLAAIVASMFAKRVIATDVNKEVLAVCYNNIELNRHLFNRLEADDINCSKIEIVPLDWLDLEIDSKRDDFIQEPDSSKKSAKNTIPGSDGFVFDLNEVDILIASDVVYADDVTDAFFRTIYGIMQKSSNCKTLYLSVEKRLNFTLEDLDIACPAYEHFRDCVSFLCELTGSSDETGSNGETGSSDEIGSNGETRSSDEIGSSYGRFTAETVENIPKYFEYNRSRYLELWKISLQKN